MTCKAKHKTGLDADQKKVLKALKGMDKPAAPKQVAEETGLESKAVSAAMKGLKAEGFVESPVRCKWAITDAGKSKA